MEPTIVASKGQVAIPREIRQRLSIRQGNKEAFSLEGGRVETRLMTPPGAAAISGFGMLKSPRPSAPADYDPVFLLADDESTR